MAERHNAVMESKTPLLAAAGLITPLTADDIKASCERWDRDRDRDREELRRRQMRFAERCRRLVSRRVSKPELAELDARRSRLPAASEYGADFWRTALAGLCGRTGEGAGFGNREQKRC